MRSLVLADLRLGLGDLLDQRAPVVLATAAGKVYYPRLVRIRTAIDALPPGSAKERPLVEALAQTDAEHDDFGAAIWHYAEAITRAPDVAPETRDAAARIRDAFIPTLSILQESYASEAAGAVDRRPKIEALRRDLEAFPLPDQRTLLAWAEGFVAKGDALSALLARRANAVVDQDAGARTRAGALRSAAIGLLSRFRIALADELADRPNVARERDREIFAFLDQLATQRRASSRRRVDVEDREDTGSPTVDVVAPIPTSSNAGTTD